MLQNLSSYTYSNRNLPAAVTVLGYRGVKQDIIWSVERFTKNNQDRIVHQMFKHRIKNGPLQTAAMPIFYLQYIHIQLNELCAYAF